MVEGWFSFHLWEDNPFLNGIPKVLWFKTHFSESASFRSSIIWHQFLWMDGIDFIHGGVTLLPSWWAERLIYSISAFA